MKSKRRSPIEEFIALPEAEKERIVAEFDQEFILDKARPLNAQARKIWLRHKRKMGRSVKGQGHKVISVSVEKALLKRADAFAKKTGMTRASLISRGLSGVLPLDKRSRAA